MAAVEFDLATVHSMALPTNHPENRGRRRARQGVGVGRRLAMKGGCDPWKGLERENDRFMSDSRRQAGVR